MDTIPSYMRYWGKAKKDPDSEGPDYHLLPYHCLDVAAVADLWWQQSQGIRHAFTSQTGLEEVKTKAWLMFFIALHDYGKWDLRFQRKAPAAFEAVNTTLAFSDFLLSASDIKGYFHGPEGLNWFYQDHRERFCDDDWMSDKGDIWDVWLPWLAAVTGHHGYIPESADGNTGLPILCRGAGVTFKEARIEWVKVLEELFLIPVGLCLSDNPPVLNEKSAIMLAGFCSVCDWLGSSEFFAYDGKPQNSVQELKGWYQGRYESAEQVLRSAGLFSRIKNDPEIEKLLGGHPPRQIQTLITKLPLEQGLTIIEASTGAGKTEAALAYAWRLLDAGLADSIVFALPSQATANAMYSRLEDAGDIIFSNETNLILAHGRARYHQGFINLKQKAIPDTAQGSEEAWVHCSEWLSQSRKRVFLGQIGVCTVDQVLVSVLPVKHKFVRGFGIGRSVLIIDEVHAYDSYMYGLLGGVLEQQKACGGSAILLSATLPAHQKQALSKAWEAPALKENKDYPLISFYTQQTSKTYDLKAAPEFRPQSMSVAIELLIDDQLLPDDQLLLRIEQAVLSGAQVCLICNLVDVAQRLYQALSERFEHHTQLNKDQLGLFHSRFSFNDRQSKEQHVVNTFGTEPEPINARDKGHLLVATQVVEQSLDLDFDWIITQLCPVDLLFQRMGRLHRHERQRPKGFESRLCTVLVPSTPVYELHELIYGNSRVLWRTQKLLERACKMVGCIEFPEAYRAWIEPVYQEEIWEGEPESVQQSYAQYCDQAQGAYYTAKQLMSSSMNALADDDANVSVLTRDGEMSLNLLLFYLNDQGERCLLDGKPLPKKEDLGRREAINLNSVPVPNSWAKKGAGLPDQDEEGLIWLEVRKTCSCFKGQWQAWCYSYSKLTGFQRKDANAKDMK